MVWTLRGLFLPLTRRWLGRVLRHYLKRRSAGLLCQGSNEDAVRSRSTPTTVLTTPTAPSPIPPEGPGSHCIQHTADDIDSFLFL